MGNTVGAPIVSEYLEDEIGPIVFKNSLGNARFLKTVKAYHSEEGYVVVKIYKKRNTKESLDKYKTMLKEIKDNFTITSSFNIMPYQHFIETDRSGYLIRQYFHNNLYDRLSTRPFLSMIEKKFIAFQLLKALEQSFFKGVFHGDIKCENVMVTTSNWVFLTDFACYKPTHIPEDNPADFSFYFDTSGRRTCYIAPERFYETNKGVPVNGELTPKMDIFSLGCVIAELFLDGAPIFDFSQLLSYRKGEYSPEPIIRQRIADPNIQSLILHMIQKEPDQRFTPEKYILKWTENECCFPSYFTFAHQFISELMRLENDDRVMCISDKFDDIVNIFKNNNIFKTTSTTSSTTSSPQLNKSTTTTTTTTNVSTEPSPSQSSTSSSQNKQPIGSASKLEDIGKNIANILYKTESFIKEADEFDKIDVTDIKGLDLPTATTTTTGSSRTIEKQEIKSSSARTLLVESGKGVKRVEGLDLFLSIIYSAVKHCQLPSTKVKCVGSLLVRLAELLDDECRLQKIVPYIMSMISTEQPTLVRVVALRSLATVLEMVQTFPPSESSIFSQYILPSLSQLSHESTDEIIRIAFAEILPQLATTAKRFLEIAQHYRDPDSEGIMESRKDRAKFRVYDSDLQEVQDQFFTKVSDLLTKDSCNTLKKIILSDIYRLCVFFGRQKTNESVLPLIITFLNDRDWQLRCAFFENIVAVCTVVGAGSLESFIYPCILLALTDEEEFVTEKALSSLSELCSLGLLRKPILLELLVKTSPMLLHPNNWIRYGVVSLIVKICQCLSKADLYCYAKPKLAPFLISSNNGTGDHRKGGEISDNISESNLIQLLDSPISRESFNKIVRYIYKNQISLSSSLNAMNNDNDQVVSSTGGSNRRLRALSKKIFIPNILSTSNSSINSFNEGGGNGNNSSNSLLSQSTEESLAFLRQMTSLNISDSDQSKIIKCFDYLQSKKCKDSDMVNDNGIGGSGNNMAFRNSIINMSNSIGSSGGGNNNLSNSTTGSIGGGSGNNNNLSNSTTNVNTLGRSTSPQLQGLSSSILNNSNNISILQPTTVEITKLPTTIPIRMVKIRGGESNLNSSTVSLGGTIVSSNANINSSPTLTSQNVNNNNNNLNSINSTGSGNNSVNSNSVGGSINNSVGGGNSINNSGIGNSSNSTLNQSIQIQPNQNYYSAPPTTTTSSSSYSSSSNNPKIDLVSQSDLNVITKKYSIRDPKMGLNQILKVETNIECSIKVPAPLPELGSTDPTLFGGLLSSSGIGMSGNTGGNSSLNNSVGMSGNINTSGNGNSINSSGGTGNIGGNSNNSSVNSSVGGNSLNNSTYVNNSGGSGTGVNGSAGVNIGSTEQTTNSTWRPMGILVSHFFEHRGAVNEIQVSSDNLFFATASNDGTVKIWDCQRMEKSVTNRARQTYAQQEGRITSISICEKTHSIASASDKGSIHVFRVGISGKQKNGNIKYTNLSTVKNITENSRGNIVSVSHYSTNSSSVVTYATTKGGIHGWDLRSQQDAFNLVNDASLGLIQAFLIDPNRNWLVTGTSRGFLTCWDLRFGIPLYNVRVSNGRILKFAPYMLSKSASESWVYISTEIDNVIVFDLSNRKITRVFKRTYEQQLQAQQQHQQLQQQQLQLNKVNMMNSSTTNLSTSPSSSSSSSSLGGVGSTSTFDFGTENLRTISTRSNSYSQLPPNMNSSLTGSISGMSSTSMLKPTPIVRALLNPPNCPFLITAGDDKRIKLWDWNNLPQSYYVSIGKEPPPFYTHKFSNDTSNAFEIHEEIWHDTSSSSFYSNSTLQNMTSSQTLSSSSSSSSQTQQQQYQAQLQQQYQLQQQQQQQQYLNHLQQQKSKTSISMPTIHHQEPILDIKMMEVPNPMLISTSTDGVIKIWK